MSNILIIHSGLTGISNACLQLSKRLGGEGHQVWTAAMKDERQKVESNGLSYVEVKPIKFQYGSEENNHGSKIEFFDHLISELDYSNLAQILKVNAIDLVLVDLELHEYIMYLHTQQFPFKLLCQWFSIWKNEGNLPPSSKHQVGSKLQQSFEWIISSITRRIKQSLHGIKNKGITRLNFILYLAEKLEFDTALFVRNQFPLPLSYRALPTLSMTHPDLELPQKPLPHLRYIYPMVDNERLENVSDQFNADFELILNEVKKGDKQLIVVTTSSMAKGSRSNILDLLTALNSLEGCISIVSLGNYHNDYQHLHNSKNLYLYSSIPQIRSLQHASLSINHGGIHTINECIHFNVPMLILSGGQYDQNGCAARVQRHGCGLAYYNSVSQSDIKIGIKSLLSNTQYKSRMQELYASYINSKETKIWID